MSDSDLTEAEYRLSGAPGQVVHNRPNLFGTKPRFSGLFGSFGGVLGHPGYEDARPAITGQKIGFYPAAAMPLFLIVLANYARDFIGRFCRWLTFRRMLGIVALLILVLCLKGIIFDLGMGADLPILFGLDWGLAIEASALLIALSVRDNVTTIAYVARRWLLLTKPMSRFLRRAVRRAIRSRSSTQHLPPPPDDRPGGWALA